MYVFGKRQDDERNGVRSIGYNTFRVILKRQSKMDLVQIKVLQIKRQYSSMGHRGNLLVEL